MEAIDMVLEKLFSSTCMNRARRQPAVTVESAPLWLLAQQSDQDFVVLLLPKLLDPLRYDSLECADACDASMAVDGWPADDDDEAISALPSPPQAHEEAPTAEPSAEEKGLIKNPSMLSQLLAEFSDKEAVAVDVDQVQAMVSQSSLGISMAHCLLNEIHDSFSNGLWSAELGRLLLTALQEGESLDERAGICLCFAWLLTTNSMPQQSAEMANRDEIVLDLLSDSSSSPVAGDKRLLSADSAECFTQASCKKAKLDKPAAIKDTETVCLISPAGPFVVDLCYDDFDFYDIPMEPEPVLPTARAPVSNAPVSAPVSTILEEMRTAEALYQHAAPIPSQLPSQPLPPPAHPLPALPDSEPVWDSLSDDELQVIAAQYGLKPEARSKLLKLLKSMWKRLRPQQALSPLQLRALLLKDRVLYERILLYQPVELDDVHALVRREGIKVSKPVLMGMLDALAVFVSAGSKKDK